MTKYFTADLHLNEDRLCDFNPYFRPFKTIDEQNKVILDNLNEFVKEKDELYVLGDVVIGLKGIDLLNEIKCQNKFLIIGNYDEDKLDKLSKYFLYMQNDMDLKVRDLECYLNHYPKNRVKDKFNIVGHVHGAWKVQPNMVNVGVDAWHFKPVSEDEILIIHNAIKNHYDENIFPRD